MIYYKKGKKTDQNLHKIQVTSFQACTKNNEMFFDHQRRHALLGYVGPAEFE